MAFTSPPPGESSVPTNNPESVIAVGKELCWRELLEVKRLQCWMKYAGFRRSTNTVVAKPWTPIASVVFIPTDGFASADMRALQSSKDCVFYRRTCDVFVGSLNITTAWRAWTPIRVGASRCGDVAGFRIQ